MPGPGPVGVASAGGDSATPPRRDDGRGGGGGQRPTGGEPPEPGLVVAGTYELVALVGRGGMGAVWSARHKRLPGRQVAIKVLLDAHAPEAVERFRREAEVASRIGHPNIIEVLDFDVLPSGEPFLVLELLGGEDLGQRLARGPIELAEALVIARQIGSALTAAHRADVVHRDLKPANVFLCPTDSGGELGLRVKVLDFGISKVRSAPALTQHDALVGTPQYMAPEQAAGRNHEIDARTDEFALAAIVYEMLTARPAFTGATLAEVVTKIVIEPAPLLPDAVPAAVRDAVSRGMSKRREERFDDVPAFIGALTGKPLHVLGDRLPMIMTPRAFAATPPLGGGGSPGTDETLPATPAPSARSQGPAPHEAVGTAPTLAVTPSPSVNPTDPALAHTPPPAGRSPATAQPSEGAKPGTLPGVGPAPAATPRRPRGLPAAVWVGAVTALAAAVALLVRGSPPAASAPDAARAVAVAIAMDASPQPTLGPDASAHRDAAPPADAVQPAADGAARRKRTDPTEEPHTRPEAALPAAVVQDLDAAEQALRTGHPAEARRLAQRSLLAQRTARAHALLARAHCQLRDLSNARAAFRNVSARDRSAVTRACREHGIDL